MNDIQREAILAAVAACDGHKVRAAEALGIGKTTLYRKLKEYAAEDAVAQEAAGLVQGSGSRFDDGGGL